MAAADEDLKIMPPPRKRKPKKVTPVGRIGLKRRAKKSRTSFGDKCHMGRFFLSFLFFLCVLSLRLVLVFSLSLFSLSSVAYAEIVLETNYISSLPSNSQLVTEDYSSYYESVSEGEGEEGQSTAEPTAKSKSDTKSKSMRRQPPIKSNQMNP
jgi:hypothetical protein